MHLHLGWFSVGERRLEKARATGLTCRDACSGLLTRLRLRSPGGARAWCCLSTLVGLLLNGWVAVFCYVRASGCRRVWRITVRPTRLTPFPFPPVHAWLVYCWPACVCSVYGQVAAAAAVWLVCGGVGRLMSGLVSGGSVALLLVVA